MIRIWHQEVPQLFFKKIEQWRIQDFPEPTPEFGTKTYYLARILPKTA